MKFAIWAVMLCLLGCEPPNEPSGKDAQLPVLQGLYQDYSLDSLVNAEVSRELKKNLDSFLTLRKMKSTYSGLQILSDPCFDAEHRILMADYIHPYKLHFLLIVRELIPRTEFNILVRDLSVRKDSCSHIKEYYASASNESMSSIADKSWSFYGVMIDSIKDARGIFPHIDPISHDVGPN